jgi:hypothetical protein
MSNLYVSYRLLSSAKIIEPIDKWFQYLWQWYDSTPLKTK